MKGDNTSQDLEKAEWDKADSEKKRELIGKARQSGA